VRDRIRVDLTQAMRDRDTTRVNVLRTALSAIGNTEAVEGVSSVEGMVGYGDVERRSLTDEDVRRILAGEIEERKRSVAEYVEIGQTERAERLQRELEILQGYLSEG